MMSLNNWIIKVVIPCLLMSCFCCLPQAQEVLCFATVISRYLNFVLHNWGSHCQICPISISGLREYSSLAYYFLLPIVYFEMLTKFSFVCHMYKFFAKETKRFACYQSASLCDSLANLFFIQICFLVALLSVVSIFYLCFEIK